jgi:toxin ParE1/3/4
MKHEIIWSKDAGDELTEIISYIKYHTGKITAEKVFLRIMDELKNISDNPAGRRIAPMLKEMGINYIHQLDIHPWVLYYKVESSRVEIISIIDERRNLEEILYKKVIGGKIK